jgi:SAM-dependent methyltransferase
MKERMMSESDNATQVYVFGHSVGETQSIQQLAQILAPVTRQFLEQAGRCAGMKVLEVGSGAGDVSLLAAELVGPSGTVIGVENNPAILETARARVQADRLYWLLDTSDQKRPIEKRLIKEKKGANVELAREDLLGEGFCVGVCERSRPCLQGSREGKSERTRRNRRGRLRNRGAKPATI